MRYFTYLRDRYRTIGSYVGLVSFLIGLLIVSPLACLPFYPEEWLKAPAFLVPGLGLAIIGFTAWRMLSPDEAPRMSIREGAVVVVLSWIVAIGVGTIPFLWSTNLDVSEALFESTSGWTTTGLSVVDVTTATHVVLLYRSIMQLAGGAGFAIIVLSLFSGQLGPGLATAEGRTQQLVPHVRHSASIVLKMYTGYVVLGIVGLDLAGMGTYDAVNHAFAAVSTGGFSTRPESIGYWDSPAVEGVALFLMLLGTTNFLTSYALIRGKLQVVRRVGEVRLMGVVLLIVIPTLVLTTTLAAYPSLTKAVRVGIFEAATALSTTGFSTVSYSDWPSVAWIVLLALMIIGGGSGSTAGGLKQYRVYILFKGLKWKFRKLFLPETAVNEPEAWQGERLEFLSDSKILDAALFAFLYLGFFIFGSAVLMAYGNGLAESLFEFASTVGTVGLSIGLTSADAPDPVLWLQTAGMLMGRLEFFVVIVGVVKIVDDARHRFTRRSVRDSRIAITTNVNAGYEG